jgi:hypothetical protein
MRARRPPPDDKQLDYDREIRTPLEAPHATRKSWPIKKARVNRKTRLAARIAVAEAQKAGELDGVTAEATRNRLRRGREIRKMGVMTLRQRLQERQDRAARLNPYTGLPRDETK